MCYPLMLCKLASVIRCDRLEMLSHVGQQQPPYRFGQQHSLLTILELFHDEEVRAALHHREDGIAVLADNQAHLQSPNRLPSASLGCSCMFTLFLIPGALVSCLYRRLWRYLILCRQFAASVPFALLRIIL